MSDNTAEYARRRYEEMFGESWSDLEARVRKNPASKELFELIDARRNRENARE